MALHKCPKCELNYIREGEDFCEVCKREMKRAQARIRHADEESDDDEVIMCTECGAVSDLALPYDEGLDAAAERESGFSSVSHHALFEGVCRSCAHEDAGL